MLCYLTAYSILAGDMWRDIRIFLCKKKIVECIRGVIRTRAASVATGKLFVVRGCLDSLFFFFQRPFSSALHSLYTTEHDNGTRFLLSRRSLLLVRTRFKNDERSHIWLLSQQVIQLDQIKIYLYIYSSLTSTIIQRKQKCVLIVLALWSFRIKV